MKEIDLVVIRIEQFMKKRRPPVEMRDQLDLGYTYANQTIEIFEIRPQYTDESKTLQIPVAKSQYIKSRAVWKIYWMRANGKWVAYDPQPEVKTVDAFLATVDRDDFACFFG